jgi:hypothetical protein
MMVLWCMSIACIGIWRTGDASNREFAWGALSAWSVPFPSEPHAFLNTTTRTPHLNYIHSIQLRLPRLLHGLRKG